MEIGKTLYVTNRKQWRAWLAKNHARASEIWLVYYRKDSGKPRIPYNDAVEEALCYGWIDSTNKRLDDDRTAQRFSPRRPNSALSEMNRERIRRLIKANKMTPAGFKSIEHHLAGARAPRAFKMPADILAILQSDPIVWKNFKKFPASYKHIRVAWIDGARHRPAEFQKRLRYFIKMTGQNKRFGMVQ